ncbi:peroxiredoxin family protein [Chryseolinea lacunae]|uniref:Redoxin domain-containing protein n=1 Tax=Chryseolinea lacunae TaxID=2801331 RepID=A0ABS1KQN0_9BACT|nr:redoxin domain-containing protein [Chryseolinea lacunae]MBL0741779.1 redoxin domain-containing protein [Chryseolinea lacunae]
MKNRNLLPLLLLLAVACGKPTTNQETSKQVKADSTPAVPAPPASDLPNLVVNLVNGAPVNLKDLKGKTILILFQPDCDHCQRESTAIRDNMSAFEDYEVYFISASSVEESVEFAKTYKFKDQINVHFALTTVENVIDTFGSISAPSLYVYSAEHLLIKHFNGETPIDDILKVL